MAFYFTPYAFGKDEESGEILTNLNLHFFGFLKSVLVTIKVWTSEKAEISRI